MTFLWLLILLLVLFGHQETELETTARVYKEIEEMIRKNEHRR